MSSLIKKFYPFGDDSPPIIFRPGTSDENILAANFRSNTGDYLFPTFEPSMCYDIGANIGVVAVILANIYPNAKIVCFEPQKDNFDLLAINTKPYKNITALNYGLGSKTEKKTLWNSDDATNYGGYSTEITVEGGGTSEISVVATQSVYEIYGPADLIKIDVEGAEYDILKSMPGLAYTRWIAGELHGINDFKVLDLLSTNFHIQTTRNFNDKVWHFHARSKKWS